MLAEENGPAGLSGYKFIYETDVPADGHEYIAVHHYALLGTEGTGTLTAGKRELPIFPGRLFFLGSGERFVIRSQKDLRYLYIEFSGSRSSELFSRFGVSAERNYIDGMDSLIPVWKESLVSAKKENFDLVCESMLLYAFSRIRHREKRGSDAVHAVIDYMEEHFTENDLTLQRMAGELGYNDKYLSHLIKEELSVGFAEHLTGLRIRYAVLLMSQGVTSVKNIAILSGYTDPLYFSKVFRKQMGVSPSAYIGDEK